MERVWAWLVHAYTTAASVLALLMVHFAYQGEVRTVLWLFLAAMVVDGTDGMLARRCRVKSWSRGSTARCSTTSSTTSPTRSRRWCCCGPPATCPATPGAAWWRPLPLVASCFQFCRTDAKTDDHFFLGFPSYWNIVAFYVVVFDLGEVATTAVLLALTVLIFVPIKYVYPSRTETLWYTNMALATAFLVLFGAITSAAARRAVRAHRAVAGLPGLLRRHQPLADAAQREFGGRTRG